MHFERTARSLAITTAALVSVLIAPQIFPAVVTPVMAAGNETMDSSLPVVDTTHPITSEDAVRLALSRNYRILLARDRMGQTKAGNLSAIGAFVPSVRAGWSYQHFQSESNQSPDQEIPGVVIFGNQKSSSNSKGYNVSADQTLFSLSSLLNIAAQKKLSGASEADVETAEQEAAFAVRQQFYTYIQAIKLLTVRQEDFRLSHEELRRTESLFEVGSVARTDVLKGRVRVAEAQTSLTGAENNLQNERARLAVALAIPVTQEVVVDTTLTPRADNPDSAGAYAVAERERPDLRAAQLRVGAAGSSHKAALFEKFPTVFHSYNRNFSRAPGTLSGFRFNSDGTFDPNPVPVPGRTTSSSWSYTLGVNMNLLDGLVTEAAISRTKFAQLEARHALEELELTVGLEVKQALLQLRAARAAVESAQEGLISAEEDLKLSQERYSVGLGTVLELIDAQTALTRARSTVVQAQAAVKIAEAQLDRAVGRRNW